jgi:lysophospholipase L1-like esterase
MTSMKLAIVCLLLAQLSVADPLAQYREAAKSWEKDIANLEKLDQENKDPENAILFTGSSSIRLWQTMAEDLKPWPTIRRGYGGAKFNDLAVYADRILSPHSYRALVIYIGNDITGGKEDKTPEEIVRLFQHVVGVSRRVQPDADIFIIGITPTESRHKVWPQIQQANAALKAACGQDPKLHYIDTSAKYLNAEGNPRSELFRDDKLHQNAEGYKVWTSIIRQNLDDVLGAPTARPSAK